MTAFVTGVFLLLARRRNGESSPYQVPRGLSRGDEPAGTVSVEDWREMISEDTAKAVAAVMAKELRPVLREVGRHNRAIERTLKQLVVELKQRGEGA
jgi:hypothetical protein